MVYPHCTHSLPNAMVYPKWEQELSLVKGGNPGLCLCLWSAKERGSAWSKTRKNILKRQAMPSCFTGRCAKRILNQIRTNRNLHITYALSGQRTSPLLDTFSPKWFYTMWFPIERTNTPITCQSPLNASFFLSLVRSPRKSSVSFKEFNMKHSKMKLFVCGTYTIVWHYKSLFQNILPIHNIESTTVYCTGCVEKWLFFRERLWLSYDCIAYHYTIIF